MKVNVFSELLKSVGRSLCFLAAIWFVIIFCVVASGVAFFAFHPAGGGKFEAVSVTDSAHVGDVVLFENREGVKHPEPVSFLTKLEAMVFPGEFVEGLFLGGAGSVVKPCADAAHKGFVCSVSGSKSVPVKLRAGHDFKGVMVDDGFAAVAVKSDSYRRTAPVVSVREGGQSGVSRVVRGRIEPSAPAVVLSDGVEVRMVPKVSQYGVVVRVFDRSDVSVAGVVRLLGGK